MKNLPKSLSQESNLYLSLGSWEWCYFSLGLIIILAWIFCYFLDIFIIVLFNKMNVWNRISFSKPLGENSLGLFKYECLFHAYFYKIVCLLHSRKVVISAYSSKYIVCCLPASLVADSRLTIRLTVGPLKEISLFSLRAFRYVLLWWTVAIPYVSV